MSSNLLRFPVKSEGDNQGELVKKPTSSASKQIGGDGADTAFPVKVAKNSVLESLSLPGEERGRQPK